MNLQRIKELAGIKKPLTESVEAVPGLNEKSPRTGWDKTIDAMKGHDEIDNPYALANYMKSKGYESHKEESMYETPDDSVDVDNSGKLNAKELVSAFRSGKITGDEFEGLIDMAINNSEPDVYTQSLGDYKRDLLGPYFAKYYDEMDDDEFNGTSPVKPGPGEFDESCGINNGYDDIHYASGDDYFPDGADSPVVSDIAPNGKQGDNPEQKRVSVTEVHKELVYNYRNFLKEDGNLPRR